MKNPKMRNFIGRQFQEFPDLSPRKYMRRQRFLRRMERKYRDRQLRFGYN